MARMRIPSAAAPVNWLRKRMPKSAYENMMRVKRTVLGPH